MDSGREDSCGERGFEQNIMLLPDIPEILVWLIYAAPITSALLIFVTLRGLNLPFLSELGSDGRSARIAVIFGLISWVLSLWLLDTTIHHHGEDLGFGDYVWLSLFDLEISLGLGIDGLSSVMIFVVASVALLVQIYSIGYMKHDPGFSRFLLFMSLFIAAMLGLVMSSGLLQLFIHWELVGLTSYLLIGFWFERPAAAAAAKKAFIVTRFGDIGFVIALTVIWINVGTFDISEINLLAHAGGITAPVLTGFTLGLLAGAAGKSAQFPLHFWLPDAMEGPTPVSSIVHSATMVAAGVYLLARFFPAIDAAPQSVSTVIAYVGGFTAIFAASMGVVVTDIKRVLAYSTVSQLGYMVMAIGLGGYVAAIFHLFTHAFFKSLLFWGAGSVSHATGTFEMGKMGGLRGAMPVTFVTFVIGSLSLAGIFPLAGFWSKDEILLEAWHADKLLWLIGTAVAFLTALYMFRAIFLTFFGEYKGGESDSEHGDTHSGSPHESPPTMGIPMLFGAVAAVTFGFFAFMHFGEFVEGALPEEMRHFHFHVEGLVLMISTLAALAGIGAAAAIYLAGRPQASDISSRMPKIHSTISRLYYVNEVAEDRLVRGALLSGLARGAELIDRLVIETVVNGAASVTKLVGEGLRRSATGQVQSYTSAYMVGLVAILGGFMVLSGDMLSVFGIDIQAIIDYSLKMMNPKNLIPPK